jgi:hypothetical protein
MRHVNQRGYLVTKVETLDIDGNDARQLNLVRVQMSIEVKHNGVRGTETINLTVPPDSFLAKIGSIVWVTFTSSHVSTKNFRKRA